MGRWNYRVARGTDSLSGSDYYVIKEAYYDEAGKIDGLSQEICFPMGESLEELRCDLKMMLRALKKPVLNNSDWMVEPDEEEDAY